MRLRALEGALLGTLVGDALGLPREGLGPRRAEKLFGPPPLRHRLLLGRGMGSDDTEHACMTAQALLASHGDPERFARSLAWRLRGWLLALPAGVGFATARATLKLWLGFPPSRSGVDSAGNGPAMRAPVIGVAFATDPAQRARFVDASTVLTHRNRMAIDGARAIAHAAALAVVEGTRLDGPATLETLAGQLTDPDLRDWTRSGVELLRRGEPVSAFCAQQGLKVVTGYTLHTVPVVLYAWLRHKGDFRATVEAVIAQGGDSDTTAAIAGALAGATTGAAGIPSEWLDRIAEWPRSVRWIRRLAARFGETPSRPLPLFWPGLLPRNVLFLGVVLLHGFRRLLPPY